MQRGRHLWSFALCLGVVLARGWRRLAMPDIWGEDGIRFIREALQLGWHTLWLPMGGYFNVFQRAMTLLWIKVAPLTWLAALICATSYVTFAFVASWIVRDDYEWLIPSFRARLLTALAICLAPGTAEVLGNLCNINWTLLIWVGLVALKSPMKPITRGELAASAVVFFSVGTGILLLPLLVLRRPLLILLGISIAATLAFHHDPSHLPALSQLIPFVFRTTVRTLFMAPWLGELFTIEMYRADAKFWLGALNLASVVGAVVLVMKNRRRREFLAVSLFAFPIINWGVLLYTARPQKDIGGAGFDWVAKELFLHRYTFPGAIVAIVFWMTVLSPKSLLKDRAPTFAAIFLFMNLVHPLYRFSVNEYGPERRWADVAPTLARAVATGKPERVIVYQYPLDFSWEFDSGAK